MKIVLKAFGLLRGRMDIPNHREKVYLHHVAPLSQFWGTEILSPEPGFKKAIFEWTGAYEKDKPVYEFTGLE